MADVRSLQGIYFSQTLLKEWTKVICPVYDIIPPGQREELYRSSEYNFIRLEAGRDLPQDTPNDNKYSRAAVTFKQWLERGILLKDDLPAIYVHDHYFEYKGRKYSRRGLIARVHLEEWESQIIRPHESTLAEAKSDRLSLLWALQANTSSILSLYEDPNRMVRKLTETAAKQRPFIDLPVKGNEGHKVWVITGEAARQISLLLNDQPLYVADGHHRYESALAYHRQRRAAANSDNDEPYDFVMMTLVEFDDPGLLILPPHRLVRGVSKSLLDGLLDQLNVFFQITDLDFDNSKTWQELDRVIEDTGIPTLVLFGITAGKILLLRPKNIEPLAAMMPYFHTDLYKQLEVSIIDHVILEEFLALRNDKDKVNLNYCYDRQDAVSRVLAGEYQMTFLLTPIKAGVIKAIADLGDKMPKKSTYFYPKVPAGLIINQLT